MGILSIQSRRGQRTFEFVVMGLLTIITVGFLTGLAFTDVSGPDALAGLVPRFEGTETVLLAASMLGATVMPHAIYLHSALARDRHGNDLEGPRLARLLRVTKWDVVGALIVAGAVNIGMLLLAASACAAFPAPIRSTVRTPPSRVHSAHRRRHLRRRAAGLRSGLHVDRCAAGSEIMYGLLSMRIPLLLRRVVTLIPALVVLAVGVDPTFALVLSQVVLSLCIPFAVVPLVRMTSSRDLMGVHRNATATTVAAWVAASLIVVLNVSLLWLTFTGSN